MVDSDKTTDRNCGIDLLRMILSFWVVSIHVLHYGGPETYLDSSNPAFYLLWFWAISMHSVINCFALISGFVLYDQKPRLTRIFQLLLSVLYHGFFITLAFTLFMPDTVTERHWLMTFFPVAQEEFWYFTSYFGAFFFVPLLIRGIRGLSRKHAQLLVIAAIVIFSIVPTFVSGDPFDLDGGNSVLWLLVLFAVGGVLKKYGSSYPLKKSVLLAVAVVCVLLTCIGMAVAETIPQFDGMALIAHPSPTLVIGGIALVLLFSSLRVPAVIGKIARFCAPFTFGIYLIHEHPLVRQHFIRNQFAFIVSFPPLSQLLAVLAVAASIWLICFVLEMIRQQIFRLLLGNTLLEKLENKLLSPTADT